MHTAFQSSILLPKWLKRYREEGVNNTLDLFSRAAPKNVLVGDAERPKNPTSVDKRSITSQTKNSRHQQPNQDQIEKKKTRMAHDLACQQVTCRQQLGPTKNLFLPLHPDDEKAGSIKSISIEKKPQKRV
jgi:hypothetical protein